MGGGDFESRLRLGNCQQQLKEYAKALEMYDRGLKSKFDYLVSQARIQKAWLLSTCQDDSIRDVAEAQRILKPLIDGSGHYGTEYHLALASIQSEQGRFDEAEVSLANAIRGLEKRMKFANSISEQRTYDDRVVAELAVSKKRTERMREAFREKTTYRE